MKVIIIGGGPAGMLAAIKSRKEKNQVTIIEKNNKKLHLQSFLKTKKHSFFVIYKLIY